MHDVHRQLQEKRLHQQIELLRTQKNEAESAVRSSEEELEQKGEFDGSTPAVDDDSLSHTHTQPFYGPISGTTPVSRCQKRTSGLHGGRED